LSIAFFFFSIFLSYFYWPEILEVHFQESTGYFYTLEKSQAFYFVASIVACVNLLLTILVSALKQIPANMIAIIQKEFWSNQGDYLNGLLINWFRTFFMAVNFLVCLWLATITFHNMEDSELRKELSSFEWTKYLWFIVLAGWPIYLIWRLSKKEKSSLAVN
ncbi:MAG: hypothetical protein SNJ77_12410, partial [Cytophagales bacterium]